MAMKGYTLETHVQIQQIQKKLVVWKASLENTSVKEQEAKLLIFLTVQDGVKLKSQKKAMTVSTLVVELSSLIYQGIECDP
ncbi:hypothetical protein GE061_012998 [Apolygus lucorum]|uniref:Uncharacterized protein n=1 Tax=Apolygus lucorum TaxID=248454 RepID=A0A8S9XXY9_APOLU|nr:hypothetical protein GE061_012998 [Apolygus lucorum]